MYYILVAIIGRQNDPAFFAHLTNGLFAFQLVSTSIDSAGGTLHVFGLVAAPAPADWI